jgi:hypothetical protein
LQRADDEPRVVHSVLKRLVILSGVGPRPSSRPLHRTKRDSGPGVTLRHICLRSLPLIRGKHLLLAALSGTLLSELLAYRPRIGCEARPLQLELQALDAPPDQRGNAGDDSVPDNANKSVPTN